MIKIAVRRNCNGQTNTLGYAESNQDAGSFARALQLAIDPTGKRKTVIMVENGVEIAIPVD